MRADHGRGRPPLPRASRARQCCCGSGLAELLGFTRTVGAGSAAIRVISWSHWAGLSSPPTISGEIAARAAAAAERATGPVAPCVIAAVGLIGWKARWMWFQDCGVACVLEAP